MESTELNKLVIIAESHIDLIASLKLCLFFFLMWNIQNHFDLMSQRGLCFFFNMMCYPKYNSFSRKRMQLKGIFLTSNGLALYTLACYDRVFHINTAYFLL